MVPRVPVAWLGLHLPPKGWLGKGVPSHRHPPRRGSTEACERHFKSDCPPRSFTHLRVKECRDHHWYRSTQVRPRGLCTDSRWLKRLRVKATRRDYQKLLAWGQSQPDRTWAIEGAHGLGRHLAQFLVAAGEKVVDVPAFLSARVRVLSRGRGRKTDEVDALATARAAYDAEHLHPVLAEDTSTVVTMLNERRATLIGQRTRTVNQLHALIRDLVPGGHVGELTALTASRLLRTIRPDSLVAQQRKALAHDLLADIRRLDRQLTDIDNRLDVSLLEHGTTLTEIGGVGTILAARIIAHTGAIERFTTQDHYASYAGVAPVEVPSGQRSRQRLSRSGNRQLNCAIQLVS